MTAFTESVVEDAALEWLGGLGYAVLYGPSIAVGEPGAERSDPGFRDVLLTGRFQAALARLNPDLPPEAIDEAFRKFQGVSASNLVLHNREAHRLLVKGVPAEFTRPDGSIAGAQVRVLDFDEPDRNDWLAVNQFSIAEGPHRRRPDILIFVNGLPLTVIELKNAADEDTDIWSAFNQLQTYKAEIRSLFQANEILAISDGIQARIGTLTADRERFSPWRTIGGQDVAPVGIPALQVLVEGVFEKRRFLDLIRYFIVFEDEGGGVVHKKMAGYHQFHAVNYAVEQTLRASQRASDGLREEPSGYEAGQRPGGEPGDRRIGVIWHTQGSGKSLTMAFYAGRIIHHPTMENPTVVVLTDRNDLDDQLFGTFSRCRDILTWEPKQAENRADLRTKLKVDSGGIVFTTIQKFMPEDRGDKHPVLSERRNIVVIADEAHRSQYDFIDGFARNMRDALPNASFIGFTGTPIDRRDANTRAVFGDYISIYDIKRAVEDGATVPIFYESRLAKLALKDSERPKIDPQFEEITEREELERREKLKSKWAQLEAIAGTEKRIALIAADFVAHYERRAETMPGKAMIVCMSRRICVALWNEIVKLRPEWDDPDPAKRAINIVMTGAASDPPDWQRHLTSKGERKTLADRFRNPDDPFRIVIVRDMWLTGFDAPCLNTMYIDKPMQGHGLMQAIARVNRVFGGKRGGWVVDYLGLADELRQALQTYTESGGTGEGAFNQEKAIFDMMRQYEICRAMFHGFDWSRWNSGSAAQKLTLLPAAQEHILAQPNCKARLLDEVKKLSAVFALAVSSDEALKIRDDVGFFQAVRAVLFKGIAAGGKPRDDLDYAIRQIVSAAIISDEVVDVFAAAGLKKPDISILSDDFLGQVRKMPQRNLAVELLGKLLKAELKVRQKRNVVQSRSFLELLEQALRRYQNRAIETAQVIEELIGLAKDMRAADARGEELKLTPDEIAFYDALEVNDSAVKVLGDDNLKNIAQELVEAVKRNVTIDWTRRESVRAQLRVIVKRILRKHGYPPDKQDKAVKTVLEQAEVLSENWATAL